MLAGTIRRIDVSLFFFVTARSNFFAMSSKAGISLQNFFLPSSQLRAGDENSTARISFRLQLRLINTSKFQKGKKVIKLYFNSSLISTYSSSVYIAVVYFTWKWVYQANVNRCLRKPALIANAYIRISGFRRWKKARSSKTKESRGERSKRNQIGLLRWNGSRTASTSSGPSVERDSCAILTQHVRFPAR